MRYAWNVPLSVYRGEMTPWASVSFSYISLIIMCVCVCVQCNSVIPKRDAIVEKQATTVPAPVVVAMWLFNQLVYTHTYTINERHS